MIINGLEHDEQIQYIQADIDVHHESFYTYLWFDWSIVLLEMHA